MCRIVRPVGGVKVVRSAATRPASSVRRAGPTGDTAASTQHPGVQAGPEPSVLLVCVQVGPVPPEALSALSERYAEGRNGKRISSQNTSSASTASVVSTASTGTPDRSARACAQEVERGGPASSRAAVAPPPPPPRRLSLSRPKKEHIDTNYQLGQQVRQPTNQRSAGQQLRRRGSSLCSVLCVYVAVGAGHDGHGQGGSPQGTHTYTHRTTPTTRHTPTAHNAASTPGTWGAALRGGRSVANETWGGGGLCVCCLFLCWYMSVCADSLCCVVLCCVCSRAVRRWL